MFTVMLNALIKSKHFFIIYIEGMRSVNVCPNDQDKVQVAAKRLRCNKDTHGNNQYMCIPNKNKTSLVEFCYDGVMGLEEKGKLKQW